MDDTSEDEHGYGWTGIDKMGRKENMTKQKSNQNQITKNDTSWLY